MKTKISFVLANILVGSSLYALPPLPKYNVTIGETTTGCAIEDSSGNAYGSSAFLADDTLTINTTTQDCTISATELNAVLGTSASPTVNINASKNIIVNSPIVWTTMRELHLKAEGNITINADINLSDNNSVLRLKHGFTGTAPMVGDTYNNANTTAINFGIDKDNTKFLGSVNLGGYSSITINGVPYTAIKTATNLQNINTGDLSGKYVLGADIYLGDTATPANFTPIGSNTTKFTGKFNGLGHKLISLKITDANSKTYLGLFGYVEGAKINNLHLSSVNMNISNASDSSFSGGLAGLAKDSQIKNVFIDGNVYVTYGGTTSNATGGLVGKTEGESNISSTFSKASLWSTGNMVGGLVGNNSGTGTIENSYATGSVAGGGNFIGGLVGNNNTNAKIKNSYALGSIGKQSASANYLGGLAVANPYTVVTNSFYNMQTAGDNITSGYTHGSKTTSELQALSTFSAWDIAGYDGVYPKLTFGGDTTWYMNGTPPKSIDTHISHKIGSKWTVSNNGEFVAVNDVDISSIQIEDLDTNISLPTGATFAVKNSNNATKSSGNLAIGDKLVITAEDNSYKREYALFGIRPQVATTSTASFVLTDKGKLYMLGRIMVEGQDGPAYLQYGSDHLVPALIKDVGEGNITQISGGNGFLLLLGKDGKVYSYGSGMNGALGLGDENDRDKITQIEVARENNITAISAGGYHSLLVNKEGKVFSFGRNSSGQLGINSTTKSSIPQEISAVTNVLYAEAGINHSMIIDKNWKVYPFGSSYRGILGNGDYSTNVTTPTLLNVAGENNITAVALGSSHSIMLGKDGKVYSFGDTNGGRLGVNTAGATNCAGSNCFSTPQQILDANEYNITSIKTGSIHSMIMDKNGTVYSFGKNDDGQLGYNTAPYSNYPKKIDVARDNNITSIFTSHSANYSFIYSSKYDNFFAFGDNYNGQIEYTSSSISTPDEVVLDDLKAPVISSSVINSSGDTITITFNEDLNISKTLDISKFSVITDGGTLTLSAPIFSGTKDINLTVGNTPKIYYTYDINLSITSGSGIEDMANNALIEGNSTVTNGVSNAQFTWGLVPNKWNMVSVPDSNSTTAGKIATALGAGEAYKYDGATNSYVKLETTQTDEINSTIGLWIKPTSKTLTVDSNKVDEVNITTMKSNWKNLEGNKWHLLGISQPLDMYDAGVFNIRKEGCTFSLWNYNAQTESWNVNAVIPTTSATWLIHFCNNEG